MEKLVLTAPESPPHLWLLKGHKAGDNAQLSALARGLDWPFVEKHLVYRPFELLSNRLLGPNLQGIVKAASSPLEPPWPDLVFTAGRRNEPVARWIQQRADRPVRLVHLGRPWAALERFDLIITTPQYRLPPRGHIVVCRLPLHGVTPLVLAEARRRWQATLGELPRPRLAVLVGGNSGPYTLYPQTAQGLVQGALAWAKERGGALMLTTSPRTPPKASTALAATLAASGVPYVHYGAAERQRGEPNPYMGFLASAEAILVTGESASMLAEAAATGRPVYIFDLKRAAQGLPLWRRKGGLRSQVVGYHLARRFGPRRMVRDVEILHRHLLAEGNVLYWEDAQTAKGIANGCPTSALDTDPGGQEDLARACRAVRALVTS